MQLVLLEQGLEYVDGVLSLVWSEASGYVVLYLSMARTTWMILYLSMARTSWMDFY